jgi:predicted metal-dependent TIM-barrel fold hydrolase
MLVVAVAVVITLARQVLEGLAAAVLVALLELLILVEAVAAQQALLMLAVLPGVQA